MRLAAWWIWAALAGAPESATDEALDPQAVLQQAKSLWDEGDLRGMIALLERASAHDPQPAYLFARARAEVRLDRCPDAVAHLEAFLRTDPPPEQRDAAHAELELCDVDPASIATEEPTAPTPTSEQVAGPTVERPPEPRRDPQPRQRMHRDGSPARPDPLGWSLVGSGGAMLVVGATLFGVGASRIGSPESMSTEQGYRDGVLVDQRLAWSGIGVGAAATAAIVGGVVRLVLVRRRARAFAD